MCHDVSNTASSTVVSTQSLRMASHVSARAGRPSSNAPACCKIQRMAALCSAVKCVRRVAHGGWHAHVCRTPSTNVAASCCGEVDASCKNTSSGCRACGNTTQAVACRCASPVGASGPGGMHTRGPLFRRSTNLLPCAGHTTGHAVQWEQSLCVLAVPSPPMPYQALSKPCHTAPVGA